MRQIKLYLNFIVMVAALAIAPQAGAQVPCSGVIIPSRTLSINWPQLGFDAARTGCNPYESILNQSNVRNLTVNWQYATGQSVAAPVFADGIVFTSDVTGTLNAVSASTGALLWLNQPEAEGSWGASPAVANGVLYLGFNDRHSGAANGLYAFNERTGALLWKYQTGVEEDSPVIANGVVYILQNGLIALNASTGEPLWTYPIQGNGDSPLLVANGVVYAFSGDAYAVNASTGTLLWQVPLGPFVTAATFANNVLYVGNANFTNAHLWALNGSTGATIWEIDNHYGISALAVADGIVYMGAVSGDGQLYALNGSTGATMWHYSPGQGLDTVNSNLTVANGILYFSASGTTSELYAFAARTGVLLWEYPNFNSTTPIVANGKVYVGLTNGVAAFHLPGQ